MGKRDLKADLAWLNSPSMQDGKCVDALSLDEYIRERNEIAEICEHALERAIEMEGALVRFADTILSEKERADKLEALARELARKLKEIKRRGDWLKRDCTEPDKVISYANDINIIGNWRLVKAKAVLGDE